MLKITKATLMINGRISLKIAWQKSWKNELNCDGVWIFGKYRKKGGEWNHINLQKSSESEFNYKNQAPKDFSEGEEINRNKIGMWVPDTKKGAFIFRLEGSGDLDIKDIIIDWDYKKDNILESELKDCEVHFFGLEMVYIPESQHYIGEPEGRKSGLKNCFYSYPDKGAYNIDSEDEILVSKKEGNLYCETDTPFSRDEVPFLIPKKFPKGYKAFWYMKYSLTSQQYVDFLNTLTRNQQKSRVASDISEDEIKKYYVMSNTNEEFERQTIVCNKRGNGEEKPIKFYTYAPQRGCNIMGWGDVTAYAAWSGLRPVTELEYEKACRGIAEPVSKEFAWGTTNIGRVDSFSGADGSGIEIKLPESGIVNCNFGCGIAPFEIDTVKEPKNPGFFGPVTVGLFSNSQNEGVSERENNGASFYNVMELSGNLWEQCVTVGNKKGREYFGSYGIGKLDKDGFATNLDWPDKTGEGAGVRGGVFVSPTPYYVMMALRAFAAHTNERRRKHGGCRLGY